MNRRGFLRGLVMAATAVALAPAVNLLSEPQTPAQTLIFEFGGRKYLYWKGIEDTMEIFDIDQEVNLLLKKP